METEKIVRSNGFSRPLGVIQLLGWFSLTFFSLVSFMFVLPYFEQFTFLGLALGLALAVILLLIFGFILTSSNPTDPWVLNREIGIKNRTAQSQYCHSCTSFVSQNSKHCSVCNRCVIGFDHHCIWVNNCIGAKNYKYFMFLCLILESMLIGMTCLELIVIIDNGSVDNFVDYVEDLYVTEGKIIFSFLVASICLKFVAVWPLGHLILFHWYLASRNLTTYQYFMIKKQENACEIAPINKNTDLSNQENYVPTSVSVLNISQ